MNAAHDVLNSLRNFGWPVLAYLIIAPARAYLLPSRYSREENARRLVLVGIILVLMMFTFFLLTEGGQILAVMKARPLWGCYVALISIAAVCFAGVWAVSRTRENRKVISLVEVNTDSLNDFDGVSKEPYGLAVVLLLACVVGVVWLARIANS